MPASGESHVHLKLVELLLKKGTISEAGDEIISVFNQFDGKFRHSSFGHLVIAKASSDRLHVASVEVSLCCAVQRKVGACISAALDEK